MKSDLTASQVKALLIVASKSRRQSAAAPYSDLLEQATSETTSVDELVRIKDLAKGFLKETADSRHREAAQLLYHVTVAAAFVHHATEISGRPMRKQRLLYERYAETWAGHRIGHLFREAALRVAGANPLE